MSLFFPLFCSTVTNPITFKRLLVDCYENSNTLQAYPADSLICATLAPKERMVSNCKFERGVKAALTINNVSYQMNTTLHDFDFLTTTTICFQCDALIDADGCANLKLASLGRLSIEGVDIYALPSVTVIKRQQANLLNCFAHSVGASGQCSDQISSAATSYCLIQRNQLQFYSVVLQECAILASAGAANSVELELFTTDQTRYLPITSFANSKTVVNGTTYLVTDISIMEDFYAVFLTGSVLNLTISFSFTINGEEVKVVDFTQDCRDVQFGQVFDRIQFRVFNGGVDVITMSTSGNSAIDAANEKLQALGIDGAKARIVAYPGCSQLADILELQLVQASHYFFSGSIYHFGCDHGIGQVSDCSTWLAKLQQAFTTESAPIVVIQIAFTKAGAAEEIALFKITEHGIPCYTQLVLNMRLKGLELQFDKSVSSTTCPLDVQKRYTLALYTEDNAGQTSRETSMKADFSQLNDSIIFPCEPDCQRLIQKLKSASAQLFGVFDETDTTLIEQYNIDAAYYVDFSRTIKYCLIALATEAAVFLVAGIVIINCKERIVKQFQLKRKRNVQLKEMDEL